MVDNPKETRSDKGTSTTKPVTDVPLKQDAANEIREPRGLSIGDRLKNFLPKQRPKRGGTARDQGFWEKVDSTEEPGVVVPRRRVTGSHGHHRSGTVDSDRLTRWNTAKELPRTSAKSKFPKVRAGSSAIQAPRGPGPKRTWSWSPKEEHLAIKQSEYEGQEDKSSDAVNHSLTPGPDDLRAGTVFANRRLSQTQRSIEAKKEILRQRRSLKESGDYLGPQGINPLTGQLDVVTPSDSEQSTLSVEIVQKIGVLRHIIENSPSSHKATRAQAEREIQRILAKEEKKLRKQEKEKQALKEANRVVRWRRQTKQWSSAQEPDLSPIAQSHRNLSFSSIPYSARGEMAPPREQLIDLSSSKQTSKTLDLTESALRDRSASSETVVRTPHQQSMADISLGAKQLLENGISFDAPNHLDDDGPLHQPQTQPEPPTFQVTGPDNGTATERDEPQRGKSFLDIHQRGEVDPGGLLTKRALSLERNLGDPMCVKEFEKRLRHKMQTAMPSPTEGDPAFFKQDLMTASKRSQAIWTSPASKSQSFRAESQLMEQCDLEFLLLDQLSEDKHSHPSGQTKSQMLSVKSQAGEGKTEMRNEAHPGNMQPMRESRVGLQANPPMAKAGTRGQITTLPHTLAQIGQPNKSMMPVTWSIREPDGTADQDAIQSISDKHEDFMDQSASTHIITTTGSVPRASPSQQLPDWDAAVELVRRRKLTRLSYKLPSLTSSGESLSNATTSQTSLTPSVSPSSERQAETRVSDTISVSHLVATKERSQRLASDVANDAQQDVFTEGCPCSSSTLHTSMSTTNKDDSKTRRTELSRTEEAHPEKEGLVGARQGFHKAQRSAAKIPPMLRKLTESSGRLGGMEQEPPPLPAQTRRATKTKKKAELEVHIPGSYPSHLDDEDAIAGLSSGMLAEGAVIDELRRLRDAGAEASQTMRGNLVWVLRLYWVAIRPVFNSESEYWQRNVRQESTWRDCMALALAFPVMLLGMTGFI